ncbi:MAG: hypothetical protein Q4C61_05870 [Lachnospiraceae bacterium]|nr:hypothetical protein [Lachnospiraceae bacterium]
MTGLCDIHCHILPGVDDGAGTMEEALSVMREAARQQIKEIIVTPHFHPGRYKVYADQVYDSVVELRRQCRIQGIDVMLYPGQECYYYTELADALDRREILTLAGSRYVLTEFDPDCPYSYLRSGLRDLQSHGYFPILAHFERYSCLREQEHLLQIREQGILLQMNFDMLLQKDSLFRKNPWRQMVKDGLVDYLGSDCHGMEFRPLHVYDAYRWILEHVDEEIRDRILYDNINKIIKRAKDR